MDVWATRLSQVTRELRDNLTGRAPPAPPAPPANAAPVTLPATTPSIVPSTTASSVPLRGADAGEGDAAPDAAASVASP